LHSLIWSVTLKTNTNVVTPFHGKAQRLSLPQDEFYCTIPIDDVHHSTQVFHVNPAFQTHSLIVHLNIPVVDDNVRADRVVALQNYLTVYDCINSSDYISQSDYMKIQRILEKNVVRTSTNVVTFVM